jgi:pimeloyl-ACP methyl ester carboxylesterase
VTRALAVAGRTLEARWRGTADSARLPIVLLHEGLGSVGLWRDFPEALAAATERRVMAYSRFGHGASDPPATPRTGAFMHEEAALVPAVLDAAGIARAILFGHSDGGSIALIAAAQVPERVPALILEAPHVFVERVGLDSIERMRNLYATSDLRERLARYHRHVDVAFGGWCDVWLDPTFESWTLDAELPHISCPVLLVQGVQDRYGTLAQVDRIAAGVSGSVERLVLDPCGHSPHRDQRDAVLAAAQRFTAALP